MKNTITKLFFGVLFCTAFLGVSSIPAFAQDSCEYSAAYTISQCHMNSTGSSALDDCITGAYRDYAFCSLNRGPGPTPGAQSAPGSSAPPFYVGTVRSGDPMALYTDYTTSGGIGSWVSPCTNTYGTYAECTTSMNPPAFLSAAELQQGPSESGGAPLNRFNETGGCVFDENNILGYLSCLAGY